MSFFQPLYYYYMFQETLGRGEKEILEWVGKCKESERRGRCERNNDKKFVKPEQRWKSENVTSKG